MVLYQFDLFSIGFGHLLEDSFESADLLDAHPEQTDILVAVLHQRGFTAAVLAQLPYPLLHPHLVWL